MNDDWKRQRFYESLLFWLLIVPLATAAALFIIGLAYLVYALR